MHPTNGTDQPARANFPLPQELRDQIYGYLLDSKNVREASSLKTRSLDSVIDAQDRHISTAHTYHFEVGVLGVNGEIAAEASKALYERNRFVVVEHDHDELQSWQHHLDTPIVSEHWDHVGRFDKWTMRVEARRHVARQGDAEHQCGRVLLLAQDLPQFCQALRLVSLGIHQTCSKIWPGADSEHFDWSGKPDLFRALHFTLGDAAAHFKLTNEEVRQLLLKPFERCYVGNLQVSVKNTRGSIEESLSHEMQVKLGPNMIWLNAMAWDLPDAVHELKKTMESLRAEGHGDRLLRFITILTSLTYNNKASKEYYQTRHPSLEEPMARIYTIFIDMAVTTFIELWKYDRAPKSTLNSLISLIQRLHHELRHCFPSLLAFDILPITPTGLPRHSGAKWLGVLWYAKGFKSEEQSAWIVRVLRQLTATHPEVRHISHDFMTLRYIHDSQGPVGEIVKEYGEDYLLSKLSIKRIKGLCWYTKKAHEYQVPEGLLGWVDERAAKERDTT